MNTAYKGLSLHKSEDGSYRGKGEFVSGFLRANWTKAKGYCIPTPHPPRDLETGHHRAKATNNTSPSHAFSIKRRKSIQNIYGD